MRSEIAMDQISRLNAWAQQNGPGRSAGVRLLGGKAEQFKPLTGVSSCVRTRSGQETIAWTITLPAFRYRVTTKQPLKDEVFDQIAKALNLP